MDDLDSNVIPEHHHLTSRQYYCLFFIIVPSKSAMKLPEKNYDDNGKVKNWTPLWPQSKELETQVAASFVHGLATEQTLQSILT
jgi:hypothetical protein